MTLFLLAALAAAQPAPAAPPSPAPTERKEKVKMICTTEQVTGSRFTKRVCQSEDSMLARQEADRQAIGEVINAPRTNPPGS